MSTSTISSALLVALGVALPAAAYAQRKSPLDDAPAVRHRVELRDKRAELGAGIGTTLNQDFYNAVTVNIRGAFHFNDWLGVSAMVGLNVTPNMTTGLHDKLIDALPSGAEQNDKAPVRSDAENSMNKISEVLAVQLEATPFAGKYSLFQKLFVNYDFYGFLGPGFLDLKSDAPSCVDGGSAVSCGVSGFKAGANFGIGMHTFVNNWLAVNAELRDIVIQNNPSGRDVNADRVANNADLSWSSNYMVSLGLSVFLPSSTSTSP